MREELDFLVCSNKQLENAYLNDNEWKQVESIIVLLEPMYKATKILSSSSYPTVSDIRLTFSGILRHIELYRGWTKVSVHHFYISFLITSNSN